MCFKLKFIIFSITVKGKSLYFVVNNMGKKKHLKATAIFVIAQIDQMVDTFEPEFLVWYVM